MKINYLLLILAISILFKPVNAQIVTAGSSSTKGGPGYKTKWTVDPFDHQVFIENKGQFTAGITNLDKIIYGAQVGDVYTFITNSGGIIYKYTEYPEMVKAPGRKGRRLKEPDDYDPTVKPKEHYLT